jgi:hypothetical protein
VPETKPAVACPAKVVTTPDAIFRMRLLLESPTNTFPLASTAMPHGALNLAFVPVASTMPAVDCPASVVTTRLDDIFRMALLPVSATKRLPDESMSIPAKPRNLAEVPVASTNPELDLPANVVTVLSTTVCHEDGVTVGVVGRVAELVTAEERLGETEADMDLLDVPVGETENDMVKDAVGEGDVVAEREGLTVRLSVPDGVSVAAELADQDMDCD